MIILDAERQRTYATAISSGANLMARSGVEEKMARSIRQSFAAQLAGKFPRVKTYHFLPLYQKTGTQGAACYAGCGYNRPAPHGDSLTILNDQAVRTPQTTGYGRPDALNRPTRE